MLSLLLRLCGFMLPDMLFATIGWASLRLMTFGRYPAYSLKFFPLGDLDVVAFLGVAESILLLSLLVWLRGKT